MYNEYPLQLLTNWFARKNVDDTVICATIFITGTKQVRSITDEFVPLQSGSVLNLHWIKGNSVSMYNNSFRS